MQGPQAESQLFELIHGERGRELGRSLITQNLIDNHDFQFYLDDKQKWLPMLESLFQDEVYIIGTVVKELAMSVNLPGKMKFFILQALGSTKIDVIADKWIECSSKDLVQPAIDFVYNDNHMEFISAWLEDDPYYNNARSACNKDRSSYGSNYIIHHYGEDVIYWLQNGSLGPEQYGILVDWQSVDWTYTEYPGGCFLAGTVVTSEEGNDVCIEDLQENDLILGRAGNVGVISSEKAGVTLTAPTPAFGFNDDEPFFLSSHPFWSQDGWRAINPVVARDENDWLEIGALHVGDYVCKAKSVNGQGIEYEWVKIERFTTKIYPAGTRFYGIHTREGPRSYHANKYLVMQNYPEITIQRVADRMAKLDKKTQQAVQKELNRIKPTLKNVLGDDAAEAVSSLASNRVLRQLTKSQKPKKKAVQSKDFTLPPLELKYNTSNVSYGTYKMPTSILIHRRQLYVDKKFVKEMLISSEREVSWCRRVEDGLWEHGCVKLYDNNMAGSGFIALTKNKNDEDALLHAELRAHFKVVIYNCDKSNEEIEPPPDDDGVKRNAQLPRSSLTWYECGSFEMGFKYDPDMQMWAAVDIGRLGGREPLGGSIKLDTDKEDNLTVDVQVPPKYAKYAEHIKLFGTFDPFYQSFQGYCIEYDPEADDLAGKTYGWRGTFDHYAEFDADELEEAKQELLKSKIHSMASIGLSTCGARGKLAESSLTVPSKMVMLLKEKVKGSLSLDDLFTLTPPDPTELHNRTFALMEKCMKYEMSDEDRAAVLGDSKPILSGAEEAVAEAHKEFIGTRFAHCYLMNALSRQESFTSRITETQRNQLLYFFAGNDKDGCMSTDQDYRSANNDLARLAFIGLCPRVQDYIDNDGPGWAEKLHKYITSPEKLLQFAIISEVDQDSAKIQKQAMVLYCLDPDQDLGLDFYNKVMMAKLQSNFDYFNGSDDCINDMIDIIGDILEVLVQTILAGDDKELVGDIVQQCQEELQELQTELDQYGKDMMATMVDFVTQVVKRGGFSGDFWDRYFTAGKNILDNMQPQIVGKALKWMCGMVLPGIAFFFTIKAFTNFDELTPEQKASVILDASNAALSMINKGGPKLLDKFKECFGKGSGDFKFVTMLDDAERSGVTLTRLTRLTESAGSAAAGEFICLCIYDVFSHTALVFFYVRQSSSHTMYLLMRSNSICLTLCDYNFIYMEQQGISFSLYTLISIIKYIFDTFRLSFNIACHFIS